MAEFEPAAFMSYVHSDDDHDKGRITELRSRLEGEIRMHTGKSFQIFQDRNDLAWGQNWSQRIDASLNEVIFLIPIITPSYFNSPACRKEYSTFETRESSLGTNQLILPIYYLNADQMEASGIDDEMGISLRTRQYSDWRNLRFHSFDDPEAARQLSAQAVMVKDRIKELSGIFQAALDSDAMESPATQPVLVKSPRKPQRSSKSKVDTMLAELQNALDEPSGKKIRSKRLEEPKDLIKEDYKIFTDEFDEVISADAFLIGNESIELTKFITKVSSDLLKKNNNEIKKFEKELTDFAAENAVAISIMIDNSGSLRGKPITFVSAWALLITEIFDRVGIETEVVGYTTRAWKGGQSRDKWLAEGRPDSPGRLNDIRYIVYKSFETSFLSSVQNFGTMLKEGILKENIDGEALLFSLNSLNKKTKTKKIILMLSDGAPVDDSTLSVHYMNYLSDHLESVISEVKESDTEIMSVGVDYDVSRYYGENGIGSDAEKIGLGVFEIMRKILFK